MLSNFVRRPRFEPATTGLSGKIHTHLTTAPSMWFQGLFYGIYTNGDDCWKGYQIRAWSCYVSWSLFCWYSTIFQLYFSHKRWHDFSQFSQTKVNETQGYATNYSLFYLLRGCKSISMGTTIPLYVIICRWQIARPHQNCTKCGGFYPACRATFTLPSWKHIFSWGEWRWLCKQGGWFQDNLSGFNSLNRNVHMIACRQWGDSQVSNQHS